MPGVVQGAQGPADGDSFSSRSSAETTNLAFNRLTAVRQPCRKTTSSAFVPLFTTPLEVFQARAVSKTLTSSSYPFHRGEEPEATAYGTVHSTICWWVCLKCSASSHRKAAPPFPYRASVEPGSLLSRPLTPPAPRDVIKPLSTAMMKAKKTRNQGNERDEFRHEQEWLSR